MRAIIIVLDGVGAGEAPDSSRYGDAGSNTLGHVAAATGGLNLPFLESLGLGNIGEIEGLSKNPDPLSSWGLMRELSAGKDTITGHWEMMGLVTSEPFPVYPAGFPPEVISGFEHRVGMGVLGNKAASGTEIIKELGEKHVETGLPIVYTSADSVFQIAAHVDVIPPERLYEMCLEARRLLVHPHNVCRVIARPFKGRDGENFQRISEKRKDFALPPPKPTVIDMLFGKDIGVYSVGKVGEMFAMRGFTGEIKISGNMDGMEKLQGLLGRQQGECLIFANLNDFDTLYGHRNDPRGFARSLEEFDRALGGLLPAFGRDDCLFITADHGCDPVTESTDHSRELVPVLFFRKGMKPKPLGIRQGFMDLGATIAGLFGLEAPAGKSFID